MKKFHAIKGKLAAMFACDSAIGAAERVRLTIALDQVEAEVEAADGDPDEEACEAKVKQKAKDMKAADDKAAADKKADDDKAAADKKAADDKAAADAAKDTGAMDAAAVDARITAATESAITAYARSRDAMDEARAIVLPIAGEVHGMDSAADVYRFALDGAKIDHAGVTETAALRAMVKMIPAGRDEPQPIALDAKARGNVHEMFPALRRFA